MEAATAQVVRLVAGGASWRQAARQVGLALATAYKRATRAEPSLRGRRRPITAERREAIRAAVLAAAASQRAIARAHGVSAWLVAAVARELSPPEHRRLAGCRPRRCHSCGANCVVWPCLTCAARGRRRAP